MPQSPIVLNNLQMPAARTFINQVFEALTTQQSGTAAPTVTYAGMFWRDTSTTPPTIRERNSANNAWTVIGTGDTTRWGNAPSASPTFTGSANYNVTAGATSNSTEVANTAHVKLAVANHGAWQTPTLQNGWTAHTTIQYRILADGMLQIKGSASFSATVGTSSVIFNLPAGFRPIQTHYPRLQYSGTTLYTVEVGTGGNVTHTATANLTALITPLECILPLT